MSKRTAKKAASQRKRANRLPEEGVWPEPLREKIDRLIAEGSEDEAPAPARAKAPKKASRPKRPARKRFNERAFWDAVMGPHNPPDEFDRALAVLDEAIAELTPGATQEVVSPAPGRWSSALPEFRARPLTKEDYDQVMACVKAIAKVEASGMTVLARIELAAALMSSACSCAYASAEAQGDPSDGPQRYRWAEDFILRRAREIYGQDGG